MCRGLKGALIDPGGIRLYILEPDLLSLRDASYHSALQAITRRFHKAPAFRQDGRRAHDQLPDDDWAAGGVGKPRTCMLAHLKERGDGATIRGQRDVRRGKTLRSLLIV